MIEKNISNDLTANTESSPQEIYAEMGHESINIASGKIS
jgi:hypothetical protein